MAVVRELKRTHVANGERARSRASVPRTTGRVRFVTRESTPRVLLLADKFGYPDGVAMGITTYLLDVLPALAATGVPVTGCILREPHPAAEPLRAQGLEPLFLSANRWNPLVALKLARLVREHRCNVIHASGIKAALMARVAARLCGAKTIVHVHDQKPTGWLVGGLHRLAAQRDDIGLCVSRAVEATAVREYHVRPERVRVVPNGVRLERFRAVAADAGLRVRQALGIDARRPVLGMFARFYPVKGHRAMLRMLPALLARCPNALLLLAGDGPERPSSEALVEQFGLGGHVRFLGHRDDVPELLAACDLFLMPSETEGLPIAAVEALAMGVPVVGFDVGGMSEVIGHGRSGWLVPFGDEEGFVSGVAALLHDPERMKALRLEARRAAERFGIEEHVRRLVECYRELSSAGS